MGTPRHRIDDERRRVFLKTLEKTGSHHAASRAASPHARGNHGGWEGFRDLIARDPEFAAEVQAARSRALGLVEDKITSRAIEGVERDVWHQGQRVGTERVPSERLLLRLAERLDPNAWAPQRKIDAKTAIVSGNGAATALSLTVEDLLLLEPKEQASLVALVSKIDQLKESES